MRLMVAGMITAALVLSGCADDEGASAFLPTGSSGAAHSTSPSAAAAFPATVEHRYGTTEIPKQPQRIVVAGLLEQDALLALGIVPVATTEWFGKQPGAIFPWATDELGDAEPPQVLSNADGYQHEAIAALRPDLIVALYSGITADDYETLSRIAPTIAQPTEVDYEVSWQEVTRTVGKAVGRDADAEALVEQLEQRFAEARAAHPEFAGKEAILATPYEGYGVYGTQDPRSRIVADLGFEFPPALEEVVGDQFFGNLSRERLDLLDRDVLIWYVETADQVADIRADGLYTNLAAAKQGRGIFLDDDQTAYQAFQLASVLSLPALLDDLVPMLAAAVDGDPATPTGATETPSPAARS